MKKKKLIIILSAILVVIILLIALYFLGLTAVSKDNKTILFTVNTGESKTDIIDSLDEKGLIKSKISAYIYVFLHRNMNLQAGEYELSESMSLKEILNKFHTGNIKQEENTFSMTFVEGKRFPYYASLIAGKLGIAEDEVINTLSDKEYLQ